MPVKLVGVIELQLSPDGIVSVRLSVPVSPWTRAMVIVDVVEEPTLTELGDVALIVKSGGTPNVNDARAV